MKCQRIILCLALLGVAAWPVWSQNKDDFFETRVRPILATECFSCHTNSQLGGLRLDSREAMIVVANRAPQSCLAIRRKASWLSPFDRQEI